jgi:diguanylate cyclase (GGDEF)-like protein/PAS domain S-box-containing protein
MGLDEKKRRPTAETDSAKKGAAVGGLNDFSQLQTLLDFLPTPIAYRDHTLTLRAVNRHFQTLFGDVASGDFDIPEELLRQAAIAPRQSPPAGEQAADPVILNALGLDYRVDHVADRRPDGSVAGFFTILSDHSGERETRQWQARLDSVASATEDAIIGRSLDGLITSWNKAASQMFGYDAAEVVGRPIAMLFPLERMIEQRLLLLQLSRGQDMAQNETVLRRKDGATVHVLLTFAAVRSGGALTGLTMMVRDLTERRRLTAEMSYRDSFDPLTGLANRSEFEKRLSRTLASVREREAHHALLYIDLDQFQLVNDACGHAGGDQFLLQASQLIQSCIRSRDSLARLGGDEFGVILEHCDADDAREVAEKIRDRMDEFRFVHEDRRFRIGATIGLAPITDVWPDTATLLKAADTACYAAKEAGRDRVLSYFEVDGSVESRRSEMAWIHLLYQAMEEDNFALYAQLIEPLHADDGGMRCEILLRLRDKDGQLIAPREFLPAAERFRIMPRVDKWVVTKVIDFLTNHKELVSKAEMISVNLSGKSLGDKNFQSFVEERMRINGFDQKKLCFEITESESINNFTSSVEFIEKMRKIGVRFSLDDFGTGVSSFGYLRKLPVDYIKIDGQFVEKMAKDPVDYATVRSIQDVAKLLGKETIAEFVESSEVEAQLRDLGVNYMQGFLRHRPMPLESLFGLALAS